MGLLQTHFSTRFVRNVFICAYLFGISIEHVGLLQTRFSTRFVRNVITCAYLFGISIEHVGLLQTHFSTRFVRNVITCAYLFGISIEHVGLLQTRFSTRFVRVPFSFPEAALLLVSTKNRDLWPCPTPEVRDSRTSRNSAHVPSQV